MFTNKNLRSYFSLFLLLYFSTPALAQLNLKQALTKAKKYQMPAGAIEARLNGNL